MLILLQGVMPDHQRYINEGRLSKCARCSTHVHFVLPSGNYFEDELPAADLYLLPKNLYAWEPEQLPKLIQKVSKASNNGESGLCVEQLFRGFGSGVIIKGTNSIECVTLHCNTR